MGSEMCIRDRALSLVKGPPGATLIIENPKAIIIKRVGMAINILFVINLIIIMRIIYIMYK